MLLRVPANRRGTSPRGTTPPGILCSSKAGAAGLSREQTQQLSDTVLTTPSGASTECSSNVENEQGKVESLGFEITTLPDGSVVVEANTAPA